MASLLYSVLSRFQLEIWAKNNKVDHAQWIVPGVNPYITCANAQAYLYGYAHKIGCYFFKVFLILHWVPLTLLFI